MPFNTSVKCTGALRCTKKEPFQNIFKKRKNKTKNNKKAAKIIPKHDRKPKKNPTIYNI